MTPAERNRYASDHLRALKAAETYAKARIGSVLTRQLKAVLVAVRKGNPNPELQVTEGPMSQAIVDIFQRTGVTFAVANYARLKPTEKAEASIGIGFYSEKWKRQMAEYALNQSSTHITSITETTRNQIRKAMADAREQRLNVRQTAKLVSERTGGQILRKRALLIARTESTTAANYGAYLSAQDSGIALEKEWIATRDNRTRDAHRAMDGKIVGRDEFFVVGGREMLFPGDPRGGARNTVNCRCSHAYVPARESVQVPTPRRTPNLLQRIVSAVRRFF